MADTAAAPTTPPAATKPTLEVSPAETCASDSAVVNDKDLKYPMHVEVLMLDTCFRRALGDPGNPDSFQRDCKATAEINRVPGASIARVTAAIPDDFLEKAFCQAAEKALEKNAAAVSAAGSDSAVPIRRAGIVATTCGFCAGWQPAMQKAVGESTAVVSSALYWVPRMVHQVRNAATTQKRVIYLGVLTYDETTLNEMHFRHCGVDTDHIIMVRVSSANPSEVMAQVQTAIKLGESEHQNTTVLFIGDFRDTHLHEVLTIGGGGSPDCPNSPKSAKAFSAEVPELDEMRAADGVSDAAARVAAYAQASAMVTHLDGFICECTNLCPYKKQIADRLHESGQTCEVENFMTLCDDVLKTQEGVVCKDVSAGIEVVA